jgi:hypothetical protein
VTRSSNNNVLTQVLRRTFGYSWQPVPPFLSPAPESCSSSALPLDSAGGISLARLLATAPVGFSGQSLISHAGTTVLTGFINALGFRALSEDRLGQCAPAGASHRPGPLVGPWLSCWLPAVSMSRIWTGCAAHPGNSPRWHGPHLDARHRARGRAENRIKTLNNTGLGKFPFDSFAANQARPNIAALASNLIGWLQLSCLPLAGRGTGAGPGRTSRDGTAYPKGLKHPLRPRSRSTAENQTADEKSGLARPVLPGGAERDFGLIGRPVGPEYLA